MSLAINGLSYIPRGEIGFIINESIRDESRRDAPLRGESPCTVPESLRDESRRDAPLRGESQFTAPEPRSGESPKVPE